jgi:hypothetical protein
MENERGDHGRDTLLHLRKEATTSFRLHTGCCYWRTQSTRQTTGDQQRSSKGQSSSSRTSASMSDVKSAESQTQRTMKLKRFSYYKQKFYFRIFSATFIRDVRVICTLVREFMYLKIWRGNKCYSPPCLLIAFAAFHFLSQMHPWMSTLDQILSGCPFTFSAVSYFPQFTIIWGTALGCDQWIWDGAARFGNQLVAMFLHLGRSCQDQRYLNDKSITLQ